MIARVAAALPPAPAGLAIVGAGDDAAVLAAPDGRVVATTDFLLEGRHFRLGWSSPDDVGHKAAARGMADVAAMGGVPTAVLLAFAAPPTLDLAWADGFTAGFARECARGGAAVVGGDVAAADAITVAVTALGGLEGRAPVTRGGARPGDVVAVAGTLGGSAAGLALLRRGLDGPGELLRAHRRPRPPYAAGPQAARLGATSMIDVSDGLLADLGHVSAASDVVIDVAAARLPVTGPLRQAAEAIAAAAAGGRGRADGPASGSGRTGDAAERGAGDAAERRAGGAAEGTAGGAAEGRAGDAADAGRWALGWILTGGEDHCMAATFPAGTVLPHPWTAIGEVRPRGGGPAAVLVDGQRHAGAAGWDHFR